MIIYSQVAYKSLDAINPLQLPDFLILSGVNGSGKTHLLQGINQENTIRIFDDNRIELRQKKYVNSQDLSPKNYEVTSWDQLKVTIKMWHEAYRLNKDTKANQFEDELNNPNPRSNGMDIRVYKQVAIDAKKSIRELEFEDFVIHLPLEKGLPNVTYTYEIFFSHHLSALFKNYQVKQYDNDVNQFRSKKYRNVSFLTDEQFLDKYGEPPWDLVNKIIKEANLVLYPTKT